MAYEVRMRSRAVKQLKALPSDVYPRMRDALRELADQPRPTGCVKLTGRNGWRIRVGDYRALYKIDDPEQVVIVNDIGHRRDIYRQS